MSLDPFATAAVVPPLAILPLPIVGALIGWRWHRAGFAIAALGGLLLTLLSMPAVGIPLLVSLEHGLPLAPPARAPPQAIVILGADVSHGAGPNPFGVGPLTLERLAAGSALYRRVHLPILVTGGKPYPGNDPSLARRMAKVLVQNFRVPVTWEERRSANTWQNAAFSAPILARQGIRSIYLVTHAWHMRRAIYCFRHFGLSVTAAPVRLDFISFDVSQLAPSISGWEDSYYAFHEWIGLVWYHLRY
ncbi:MAG: YdcF family protein [Rhodospirillales bacterium]|nr:YdcF family protein [Rhodospirillales bacterium]